MRRFAEMFWMFVLWFCATGSLAAQEAPLFAAESGPRHLMLLLKDKPRPADTQVLFSPRAAKRRLLQGIAADSLDWPVNREYLEQVSSLQGVRVRYASRWMNALLLEVQDSAAQSQLAQFPFVMGLEPLGPVTTEGYTAASHNEPPAALPSTEEPDELRLLREQKLLQMATRGYGLSHEPLSILNGIKLHDLGYRGAGMLIAVLDAGFSGVNRLRSFDSLNDRGLVRATRDFVRGDEWVYAYSDHGTKVLGCMAANHPNVLVGSAPDASYLLLRSENADSEWPVEAFYWLVAAEFADSMGADIINSSLGYTTFDDAQRYGYRVQDLDGKTTLVSRAAAIAASRGMLVVSAAGNEGDGVWEYISAPADAPGILSVGAVDAKRNSASFSGKSPGPGRHKPEVAAPGVDIPLVQGDGAITTGSGTSFSAPLLSGLAACLWQSAPRLDAQGLRSMLMSVAHRGDFSEIRQGHGVPNLYAAACLLGSNPYFKADASQMLSDIPEVLAEPTLFVQVYAGRAGEFRYVLINKLQNRKAVDMGSIRLEAGATGVFHVKGLEHPAAYMLHISGPGQFSRVYPITRIFPDKQKQPR